MRRMALGVLTRWRGSCRLLQRSSTLRFAGTCQAHRATPPPPSGRETRIPSFAPYTGPYSGFSEP